ncbi:hypothetical protein SAMN05421776_11739 [Nocardia farcinica]|uniref:Uncharacterized protein n=1 Tax=Nocardia farcinica TaxID=37329 RepID=A0A0H5NWX9_NOCFR|nr:hypothetical protein [Nocardia farcinica]PFW99046.1 hypothetical protein CJ469_05646 [Nocardia farcinica]PFX06084.1 hypothetical protein CJ468_04944 [Nocardia farcinica]CRY79361.1 Uncharacterised protein [Nocardia farcinica]CRY79818.1 Uncharacterised protein [Nocardia farcinica]SIT33615.1 hypothetical protein SAMN05421776_11739 [Nocardia farcinica]
MGIFLFGLNAFFGILNLLCIPMVVAYGNDPALVSANVIAAALSFLVMYVVADSDLM